MKVEIKSRWSLAVLFTAEMADDTDEGLRVKLAVELAVKSGADLSDANLSGADLSGAYLGDANLRGADLSGAYLRDAYLRDANLRDANLRDADLSDANLRDADLRDADLRGAYLRDANLRGADLSGANLLPIRDDLWAVLSSAPNEVAGLRAALAEGRVDGSTYTGECACLVGTIANVRGCEYDDLGTLKANSSRPAECFFLAICPGDTPDKSEPAKIALEWVDEWLTNMKAAFGARA